MEDRNRKTSSNWPENSIEHRRKNDFEFMKFKVHESKWNSPKDNEVNEYFNDEFFNSNESDEQNNLGFDSNQLKVKFSFLKGQQFRQDAKLAVAVLIIFLIKNYTMKNCQ